MQTFFCDEDYQAYIDLMVPGCHPGNVEVWAYCLMPNHLHLIALPTTDEGLRRAIGEVHRRFTRRVNLREGWRDHRWQGRFASFPLDEQYLLAAARYVELNPVRAKLAVDPFVWRWSSAVAPLAGQDDSLVTVSPLLGRVSHWREFLLDAIDKEEIDKIVDTNAPADHSAAKYSSKDLKAAWSERSNDKNPAIPARS